MAASLPLFPLGTVLLPGAPLPLHIFEPRYRQLTFDLVTGVVPDKQFGIVAMRDGWAPDTHGMAGLHEVGCTAELLDARRLPDGRFNIVTRGARRFRLRELDAESRPYLMGTVEYLPDDPAAASDASISALAAAARAAYRRYCATARRNDDWSEPGPDVSPDALAHVLAADCVLPVDDRQRLLEQTCPAKRLRMVRAILTRETELLTRLRAVPASIGSFAVEHSQN
ncbi:LON peptidase substrate-binding domain-containing protein [Pseudonocardia asaccharolytica]|uniref:Peptidase n=1 Tax=Pseudonocardia asaccharolytica DSM 44247 = NBRC 16224 TaxID=1123024 RepID=A0A511D487_9PSEU|nr:LON peptidase substrate-binding domain-containing protein [Pseudonocardia asaccharolytica]GEL19477.1 peptidase [Pseudonocardia asaccharolytica DSM 44247 = NBRC 16224]